MEEPVTVVVDDADDPMPRRMAKLGARVVQGPASEVGTLRAAGVQSARALALAADDDVGNIHVALAAQELNPRIRLVVRMFNLRLGNRIDDLFDDCTVLSASTIAAPFFVDAALGDSTGRLIRVGDRQLVAGPPNAVGEVLTVLSAPGTNGSQSLLPADPAGATLVLGRPRNPVADDASPSRRRWAPRSSHHRPPGAAAAAPAGRRCCCRSPGR